MLVGGLVDGTVSIACAALAAFPCHVPECRRWTPIAAGPSLLQLDGLPATVPPMGTKLDQLPKTSRAADLVAELCL